MAVIFQPDRYLLRRQIADLAPHVQGRVLDVGAGRFSRYQKLINCDEYVKMDLEVSSNIDVAGKAEAIPFGNERFDSVLCTQLLGDLPHPVKACREFGRILKPGGTLLVTESFMNELHDEPHDYWRFTRYGLERLLTDCGFDVLEMDQRGGFFSTIAQNKIRYLIDRFRLYERRWAVFVGPLLEAYGRTMLFLDQVDRSKANRKHAIGWCAVARKPQTT